MENRKPILVLDDDPDVAALLKRVLEHDGYLVETASHGEEALAICARGLPCMLLVDLMMPHMDGEAFLKKLRSTYGDKVPPVALVTASVRRDQVGREMNVVAAIPKPFELEDVRDLVEQYCPEHRTSRSRLR